MWWFASSLAPLVANRAVERQRLVRRRERPRAMSFPRQPFRQRQRVEGFELRVSPDASTNGSASDRQRVAAGALEHEDQQLRLMHQHVAQQRRRARGEGGSRRRAATSHRTARRHRYTYPL